MLPLSTRESPKTRKARVAFDAGSVPKDNSKHGRRANKKKILEKVMAVDCRNVRTGDRIRRNGFKSS